jgi:hypothetical protein
MRGMTANGRLHHLRAFSPFILVSLMSAALCSCSDGDTVLALNVKLNQSASSARTLAVNITQAGQSALDTTVTIATKETDAGTVVKNNTFFERITLPSSYTEAEVSVHVVAKDSAGKEVGSASGMMGVRPNEAIAGYITLGEDPPPPDPTDAGTKY